MRKKKTAIIIGAGIGGLATAIQLAQAGISVTLFEKNAVPGGRCGRIQKDGHIFDTGPTMYIFPEIYDSFFMSIGERLTDYVKLVPVDPIYKLYFPDDGTFLFTQDTDILKKQLDAREKDGYTKYLRLMRWSKRHYHTAITTLTSRDYAQWYDYFSVRNLMTLIRTRSLENHYRFVGKFFQSPTLRAAFTFQDSYLSLNPFTAPSIYSLFPYNELTYGSFLPQGGMYQIIDALARIAEKLGVIIHYASPVQKISIADNRAAGVVVNKHLHTADTVVVNADLSHAYETLLPSHMYSRSLLRKKYSCSAITFHWGVDRRCQGLAVHNLFFAESYRDGFNSVLESSRPPDEPHFYVQAPAHADVTRAPRGRDTLTVMIPINNLSLARDIDWDVYRTKVREYILSRLAHAGLPDLRSHITCEISHMQQDWHEHLNLPYGSIYGLDHNLFQLGYLRPHRRHARYKNLYFVGASTHPGSGLPTVLQSAQFTARAVLNHMD